MNLHDISKRLGSMLEARILTKHITRLSDADMITLGDIPFTAAQSDLLDNFINQRLQGRPVSKIIGEKDFYGRTFYVTDDVLDPRPDSETLISAVLEYIQQTSIETPRILDLGTGSGCLALTLLAEIPGSTGLCADISAKALAIARRNAEHLGLTANVDYIESNWLDAITGEFDIIISNPPYIESCTLPTLSADVRDYDPHIALDGGDDGLAPYRVIFPQIRKYIKNGGFVALEHGTGQSSRIMRLVDSSQFEQIRVHHDFGGHDRVITAIAR